LSTQGKIDKVFRHKNLFFYVIPTNTLLCLALLGRGVFLVPCPDGWVVK